MQDIENSGSAARDHLANERTYLAWVRTGLGVIGVGLLVEKLVESPDALVRLAGVVLCVCGAVLVAYAAWRHQRVSELLVNGRFPVARRGPLALAIVSVLLALGGALFLLRR